MTQQATWAMAHRVAQRRAPGGLAKTDNQNRETPMTMHERERQTKTNLRAAFLAMMLVMMSVHT
jgi:hypothetical protein